jgi:hypothetical protein
MKMKTMFFLILLVPMMLTPAFSQSLITFDVDTTQFVPGEMVELQGKVELGFEEQPIAIEIKDASGNIILIRTITSDSNGDFSLKFKVPNSATSGEFDIVTNLEISGEPFSETTSVDEYGLIVDSENIETSQIACGAGTIEKDGICVVDTSAQTEKSSKGGGCLIATATYGSEMALEVQQLRELRDNSLLQTQSGAIFMGMFNDVYYSFSPTIADMEREHPMFKEAVKLAITPMISSLSILNYVDMNLESEVLGYGISLILLNGMMYLGIPAVVIIGIKKKF